MEAAQNRYVSYGYVFDTLAIQWHASGGLIEASTYESQSSLSTVVSA